MLNHKTRVAMVAGLAAFALLAGLAASPSFAQCCGTTTVAPAPYAAGRISWTSAYGVNSTCNPWVPGSCGYSVYRPVTAYSPITTTAYMPVARTAYMPVARTAYAPVAPGANCVTTLQTRQVPGQPIRNLLKILLPPYRPVPVTTCYTPSTACYPSSCGSCNSCYSTSYAPSACSSCDSCGSCSSPSSSCISGACDSGNVTPAYYSGSAPASESARPSTYKQESSSETELHMAPIPDSNTGTTKFSAPKEVDRDNRTAMHPVRQAVLYRPVSLGVESAATVDVGGWRASSD